MTMSIPVFCRICHINPNSQTCFYQPPKKIIYSVCTRRKVDQNPMFWFDFPSKESVGEGKCLDSIQCTLAESKTKIHVESFRVTEHGYTIRFIFNWRTTKTEKRWAYRIIILINGKLFRTSTFTNVFDTHGEVLYRPILIELDFQSGCGLLEIEAFVLCKYEYEYEANFDVYPTEILCWPKNKLKYIPFLQDSTKSVPRCSSVLSFPFSSSSSSSCFSPSSSSFSFFSASTSSSSSSSSSSSCFSSSSSSSSSSSCYMSS